MSDGIIRLFPAGGQAAEADPADLRALEAILFASAEPLSADELRQRLPASADVEVLLGRLAAAYVSHGVNVVRVAGKWAFRTAPDLGYLMGRERLQQRKLSRAATETLTIIAYHQPVTRAEIEDIRGVSLGSGTLDVLIATGWVRIRGRRRTPGRPVAYGTSDAFLEHFGLGSTDDLPGVEELSAAGLLAAGQRLPGLPGEEAPAEAEDEAEELLDYEHLAAAEGDPEDLT